MLQDNLVHQLNWLGIKTLEIGSLRTYDEILYVYS